MGTATKCVPLHSFRARGAAALRDEMCVSQRGGGGGGENTVPPPPPPPPSRTSAATAQQNRAYFRQRKGRGGECPSPSTSQNLHSHSAAKQCLHEPSVRRRVPLPLPPSKAYTVTLQQKGQLQAMDVNNNDTQQTTVRDSGQQNRRQQPTRTDDQTRLRQGQYQCKQQHCR